MLLSVEQTSYDSYKSYQLLEVIVSLCCVY